MRVLAALLIALPLAACGTTVNVPAVLYTPLPPTAPLFDGVGDASVEGRWGVDGWSGAVSGSPLPHLGLSASASSRQRSAATLNAADQRMVDGAVTLYGPTTGRLRTELQVGAGAGDVAGYAGRIAYDGGCIFGCRGVGSPDESPTTARLDRRHVQVTVGTSAPTFQSGLLLRLTDARVSDVRLGDGAAGASVSELFVEPGAFVRFGIGPADLELSLGFSRPLSAAPRDDAERGPERTFDDVYRSQPISGGVGLRVDLGDLWLTPVRP